MSDTDNIHNYSNPTTVMKKANKLFKFIDFDLKLSDRKKKKYMIKFEDSDKWVHFGQIGYEDYTKHRDKKRRQLFLTRNHKWAKTNYNKPSFLSYYLLW